MKCTILLALVVVVALVVPSQAISCRTEPERCKDDQCCVEFGIFGRCRPLLKEGETCELRSIKSGLHKHVYMLKCPCAEGLTCVEDDSGSIITGKCLPA